MSKAIIEPKSILKKNSLRLTDCRSAVLNAFLNSQHALAHSDLERTLQERFDRVTIYRTLISFLEKGIIHKILDDSGGVRYAMCSEHCADELHTDNHIHFKCTICGHTQCLEDAPIPSIILPKGYKADEVNFLVMGTCAQCGVET